LPLTVKSLLVLVMTGLAVCACAGDDSAVASPQVASASEEAEPPRHQVSRFQIGKPYNVAGRVYRPSANWAYDEVGTASWYGGRFHGRKTASGEVFDKSKLTAAHPTLPLPVIAKVTNLSNGRSVKVRINDRGPFAHGRIIDVSRAAATELGFIGDGVAKVRVQVIADESQALLRGAEPYEPEAQLQLVSAVPVRERSAVFLQVGSFSDRGNAEALRRQLSPMGQVQVAPAVVSGKQYYRVRMGPFINAAAALNARDRLATAGVFRPHLVIERENVEN